MLTTLLIASLILDEPHCDCAEKAALMKEMRLMFYVKNPDAPVLPEAESSKIQAGHLEFLEDQRKKGNAFLIGPLEHPTKRGIALYAFDDTAKVKEILTNDPAMKAGRFIFKAFPALIDPVQIKKVPKFMDHTSHWVILFKRTAKTEKVGFIPADDNAAHNYMHQQMEAKKLHFTAKIMGTFELESFWVLKDADESSAKKIATSHPCVKVGEWEFETVKWWTAKGNFTSEGSK